MRFFPVLAVILISNCIFAQTVQKELTPQEEAQQLERFSDDVRFENARRFVELKIYDKALQYLGEYIEVFINGAHREEAINYIAQIHFQQYDYMKALKYYNLLYEENNNNETGLNAYYNMGLCYSKMGYSEKANAVFNMLIEEHPDSETAAKARLQADVSSILQ